MADTLSPYQQQHYTLELTGKQTDIQTNRQTQGHHHRRGLNKMLYSVNTALGDHLLSKYLYFNTTPSWVDLTIKFGAVHTARS